MDVTDVIDGKEVDVSSKLVSSILSFFVFAILFISGLGRFLARFCSIFARFLILSSIDNIYSYKH